MLEIMGLHLVLILLLIFQVICIVVNYGTMMAYLSRSKVVANRPLSKVISLYAVAIYISIFGAFSSIAIITSSAFSEHGWKLWHGEIPRETNKWYKNLQTQSQKEALKREYPQRYRGRSYGNCNSIWE